jgi:hypothetical protein
MQRNGCSPEDVAHYTCKRASQAIEPNGRLDAPVWALAEKSPRFVDMVTGDPAIYGTRAAALWDDDYLYVGFWVEEPFVTARLAERDSLVFLENDIEVFIDGGDCYYEFEINALGTVYEVLHVWQDAYATKAQFRGPELDVLRHHAISFGGDYDRTGEHFWKGRHPRGLRWSFRDWDLRGLRPAVHVDGAINDPAVVDRGWTVELAIPWSGIGTLANGRSLPPRAGDVWRIFFGRFELLTPSGVEISPHPASAWNRHGVYDTHLPECWTSVAFTNEAI